MIYEKQISEIEKYFKSQEKSLDNFKIGAEFEHFIIDKDSLETQTYWHENGVRETLEDLVKNGWEGYYEGDYILGATKGDKVVTLEPGSQFEFSVNAQFEIAEIEREYLEFVEEISQILDGKNQAIIAVGYHPQTKIEDIKLLPKKRYDYMFNYFKDKGKYAHNMMKGTASLQVSLDYKNEEDYVKKFKIANGIAPIMYGLCDNAYYFQGEKLDHYGLRTLIWLNMDDARSGTVEKSLDKDFSYRSYAEYILNSPPIFKMEDGEAINTGDQLVRDIFDPEDYKIEELEHLMTMVFPDVRTKGFIEIRMMDALAYPYNFGIIGILKGLFYSEKNLEILDRAFEDLSYEDIIEAKEAYISQGIEAKYLGRSILEWSKDLSEMAKEEVSEEDKKYIEPIIDMLGEAKNPYLIIQKRDGENKGIKYNLEDCILKSEVKE